MAQLEVNLVSAERKVWEGSARMVVAPAADGEIGVLAGHVPVLSALKPGRVRIHRADASVVEAEIDGGFVSVDSDVVTVVVEQATVHEAGAAR